jgi:hypothetical protein
MAIDRVGGNSALSGYERMGADFHTESNRTLSPEEQQQVNRLKAIDRKVHAHEQAHMAAGSGITGGASFQYVRGPDGRQYAVAGEVSINVSAGQSPESTIERARQIQAAALAPVDPSPQDRAVAAAAAQMMSQARAELSRMKQAEQSEDSASAAQLSPKQLTAALLAYSADDLSQDIASQDVANRSVRIDQFA